jgi:hypothetical protein
MRSSSGLLPPDVLARTDLRAALTDHDFAVAFRLIKKWGGLSQNRIASACQLTPGKVSTIIAGTHRVTSYDVVCRIADGLRIPGQFVGLADRPWESNSPPRAANPTTDVPLLDVWHSASTVQMTMDLVERGLALDRRAAARALAGTAVTGTALLNALEGWLGPGIDAPPMPAPRLPGRLGLREVDELESLARTFRALAQQGGGGLCRRAVLGQLADVANHLGEHQSPEVEQRLYQVVAQLGGVAATMAWDEGHQRQAQDYYRMAVRAAHAAQNHAFGANLLAGMARQMLYIDRPHDALELVRLAQKGIVRLRAPRLRAMLHTREAWAYASMGRTAAFRRATQEATEALADAEAGPSKADEPYWIAYFDAAEMAGVTGGRLLDLARQDPLAHAEAAADSIRVALATRGPEAGRSYALDLIGLAECGFLLGDPAAGDDALRAADAAACTQSNRVRTKLGSLYPYTVRTSSRTVAEARARVREVLAS